MAFFVFFFWTTGLLFTINYKTLPGTYVLYLTHISSFTPSFPLFIRTLRTPYTSRIRISGYFGSYKVWLCFFVLKEPLFRLVFFSLAPPAIPGRPLKLHYRGKRVEHALIHKYIGCVCTSRAQYWAYYSRRVTITILLDCCKKRIIANPDTSHRIVTSTMTTRKQLLSTTVTLVGSEATATATG